MEILLVSILILIVAIFFSRDYCSKQKNLLSDEERSILKVLSKKINKLEILGLSVLIVGIINIYFNWVDLFYGFLIPTILFNVWKLILQVYLFMRMNKYPAKFRLSYLLFSINSVLLYLLGLIFLIFIFFP